MKKSLSFSISRYEGTSTAECLTPISALLKLANSELMVIIKPLHRNVSVQMNDRLTVATSLFHRAGNLSGTMQWSPIRVLLNQKASRQQHGYYYKYYWVECQTLCSESMLWFHYSCPGYFICILTKPDHNDTWQMINLRDGGSRYILYSYPLWPSQTDKADPYDTASKQQPWRKTDCRLWIIPSGKGYRHRHRQTNIEPLSVRDVFTDLGCFYRQPRRRQPHR